MYTQHPTLLIGPSDWNERVAPKAEFERRITALWEDFPASSRAIVFGSAANHAELAYLTHFVPKLEPAIALLSRDGAHKLLFGGGPNMIGAMKPLTFISDMAPLGALSNLIAGWNAPLLIGGAYMAGALRKTIDDVIGGNARDATPHLWSMMRRKSASELGAIRHACEILNKAVAAVHESVRVGLLTRTCVLAGERLAIDAGAQDIRTLFSSDGGRTLRPLDMLYDGHADPLLVYIAVRRFNYWAEGFACVSNDPQPAVALAQVLLDNALTAIRTGTPFAQLAKITALSDPYRIHPVIDGALASPIGLSLLPPSGSDTFTAGEVYSIRVGLTDGANQNAIVSAMIALRDDGNELLWRSGIA